MFETIKTNVLLPLAGRVGTMLSGVLVTYGVHATYAEQIGIGVTALALVAADLALSYLNRKRGAK